MMKVAFFVHNSNLPDIDYSNIISANPGIGGSEYEFLLVPYLLQERDNNIEPHVLVNFSGIFPHKNVIHLKELEDACQYCVDNGISEIVIDIKHYVDDTVAKFNGKLKAIIWAHNNVPYKLLNKVIDRPYIGKIVNCGREELELYRDHKATLKSTYVYNIFPFKEKKYYEGLIKLDGNHNVVYMGSLVPVKGFHVLARNWKKVLAKVPDAQLYIIGTGKLYDRNAILGKFGFAQKDYEDYFMKYLVDSDGNLLPSVHFLGLLGEEKYKILGSCKVAVPNPTGLSECLPITTIEMQLMGCNITTILHPAYLDTVFNTDYLYKKEAQLSQYIVKRLLDARENYDDLFNYVTSKFGIEGNIQRWEDILNNIDVPKIEPISQYHFQFKSVKDLLFHIKNTHDFLGKLPSIEQYYILKQNLKIKYRKMFGIKFN